MLVPLYWDPDPICVVTVRAAGLRDHGGEVSFPGGKPEPGEDLCQTAIREAEEELGEAPTRVFGQLSSVPVYTSSFRLEPWVGQLAGHPDEPNPDEVARVVALPIGEILHLPYIDGIPFEMHGLSYHSPVFETGARPMFGATAHTFLELLTLLAPLFGLEVPPLKPGKYEWEDLRPDP